jgi:hypothetical protein
MTAGKSDLFLAGTRSRESVEALPLKRMTLVATVCLCLVLALPSVACAALPRVGGYLTISPTRPVASTTFSTLYVTAEGRVTGAGTPSSSGGGLYKYRFKCRETSTKFYVKRYGSNRYERVSRNVFSRVISKPVELDAVGDVRTWVWIGSGSSRYRLARVIYADMN